DLHETTAKHLEIITATISRLASHSFLLKGWSVTLASGVLALAVQQKQAALALCGLPAVVALAILDAYYLSLERRFRSLYNSVRSSSDTPSDLSMDIPKLQTPREVASAVQSLPTWLLHGVLAAQLLAGYALLR
ncbi:unnamed protein product, partial [Laminaria digitata]